MLAIILIAVGMMILLGDPSVADEDGADKLKALAKGIKDTATGNTGAPKISQDFWGWLWWDGDK